MSIITLDYFNTGSRNVPNIDAPYVAEYLQSTIDIYESRYLESVLGYPMCKAFLDDLTLDTIPERALNLLNGVEFEYGGHAVKWCGFSNETTFESPIADFVMANYISDNSSSTTGIGEAIPKAIHAATCHCLPRVMQNWNNMIKANLILYAYLKSNAELYPEFDGNIEAGMFKPINYLGI